MMARLNRIPERKRVFVRRATFVSLAASLKASSRALALAAFVVCAPLGAEVDRTKLPPPPVTAEQREALLKEYRETERAELEKEFRAELEARFSKERDSYAGSLTNLWASSAAVWAVLMLFIGWQALSLRKQAVELAKLKAVREERG